MTMTPRSRRSPVRRAAARVLPSGVKRVLHRMLDATRAIIGAVSPQGRTTRAMLAQSGVRLPPINMTAHIPRDHARQVGSQYYIKEAMRATSPARMVMDLGCGDGSSAALFRSEQPEVRWEGVDITESGTVRGVHAESVVILTVSACRSPTTRFSSCTRTRSSNMFVIHRRCCSRSNGCSCRAGSSSAASRSSSLTTRTASGVATPSTAGRRCAGTRG